MVVLLPFFFKIRNDNKNGEAYKNIFSALIYSAEIFIFSMIIDICITLSHSTFLIKEIRIFKLILVGVITGLIISLIITSNLAHKKSNH
jgi:hypothetical protein